MNHHPIMSDDPIFHYNVPFYHDRSDSTNSHLSLDLQTVSFIEGADEIRSAIMESNNQNQKPKLKFYKYREDMQIPKKATKQSVGWDLFTMPNFNCIIPVGQSRMIPLGIAFCFPDGYYGQLQSRSGLAFQHGVYVQAGVIEPDYDGDIYVLLHNFGKRPFHVYPNTRICQLILLRYENTIQDLIEVSEVERLKKGLFVNSGSVSSFWN